MSFFVPSLVLFSILIKLINSKYLVKIKHKTKILIISHFFIIGIIIIKLSVYVNLFWLCLFGTILFGVAKSFGDMVIQGFIKGFPPKTFGGYCSGTGMAGVFGSCYYLSAKLFNFGLDSAFIFLIPFYIIYYIIFVLIVR